MNACVNLPMFVLTLLHYFNRGLKSLSLPHRLLHGAQLVIQGQGKSKGKSPKGGKGKQTWVAEYKVGDEWRPICMKFQSNRCSMENCKFAHVCAHHATMAQHVPDDTRHSIIKRPVTDSRRSHGCSRILQLFHTRNLTMEVRRISPMICRKQPHQLMLDRIQR